MMDDDREITINATIGKIALLRSSVEFCKFHQHFIYAFLFQFISILWRQEDNILYLTVRFFELLRRGQ